MKHLYILLAISLCFLLLGATAWGQIAAWDFTGVGTASLPTYAATTFNANLVSSSGANNITRGAGAAWSTGSNSFRTQGFQNNGISTANTDYFQVTLGAASGYKLSLSTIDAKFGGTSTFYATPGVTSQFAYSLDGTNFTLIGSPVQSTSLTMTQVDLTGVSALQNVAAGTTVTIRYYASGQTTTGGWGFLSASTAGTNGLAFGGTVTALSPTVTIANNGSPAAGNITQGTNDVVLFGFSLTPTGSVDFTAVNITTAGTSTTSDLSNFRVYYDADNSGTVNGGESSVSGAGIALANPLGFTISGQTGFSTARRYLLVADVAGGATVGNTFTGSIANASDVTTTGTESGTAAGNQQTIVAAATPTITVGSITGFGPQTVNTISSEKSYSVTGANLTEGIVVTAPSGFKVSLTSGGSFGSSINLPSAGGTVYVRFEPPAVTSYLGNITHTSAGATQQDVAVSGTGTAPTNPASFTATVFSSSQINLAATANANSNDIVVVFNGTGTFTTPTDGVAPGNVGDAFAGGTILYKGAAGSLTNHTGLSANQTVYYEALSHDALYYYSSGSTANATTYKNAPTTQESNITFPTVGNTSLSLSWTAGDGDRRIVIINTSNSFTDPTDGTSPSSSTVYGGSGEQVIYNGTGNTVTVTGLTATTTYYFRAYGYNNTGANAKFNISTATNNPNSQVTNTPAAFLEDFEVGTKTAYAIGNVICTMGSWSMNDALIGTSASDRKNGLQSVRLRDGDLTMNFDITNGAGDVTIYHAKYGSDANKTWKLQKSMDGGGTWVDVGSEVTTSSTTLAAQVFNVNQAGTVRFRVLNTTVTTGVRVNIDDVSITNYTVPTHTVTFNANGGSGSMSPQTASTPTALTLNTFTYTGHHFTGWNTEVGGGGTSYADGATYSFAADITLYAQWAASPVHNVTQDTYYLTIQAAVTAANPNDLITVAAGTYNENQILITTPLTLTGAGSATTIIDGGGAALATSGLVRITAGGNVSFSGFTLQNAGGPATTDGGDGKLNVGIYAQSSSGGVTYTISNNKIIGTNNASDEQDYGFYSHSGLESLVFTGNDVTHTGANAVLIEKHPGATEIANNTLNAGVGPSDAIFCMTYGGTDVTTLQYVHNNTIDLSTGGTATNATGVTFASSFNGTLGSGTYTNIQITNNIITGLKASRRGITLWNGEAGAGTAGDISNAIITGNTITGLGPLTSSCRAIQFINLVSNAVVTNNTVSDVERAFRGFSYLPGTGVAVGTHLWNNSFTSFGSVQWGGTDPLDASANWFGSADPTVVSPLMDGPIDFTPLLSSGTDTDPVTPGFQPSFSTLQVHALGSQAGSTGRVQEGVDLVSGSTVNVAAGTYREQVYINKNLVLHGAGAGTTTIAPPTTLMNQPFLPDRQERPIIGVGPLGTNVTVEGFTVDGEGAGNTQASMTGIQYFKASGIVRNNTVKRVRATPFDGDQTYAGILANHTVGATYTHTVEINNNTVEDFGKAGIVCNEAGLTVNIHHNTVTGQGPVGAPTAAQNGIQVGWGATGTIAHNAVSGISYTGPGWSASSILAKESDGVLDINNNTVTNGQVGIYLSQSGGGFGSSATLTDNTITANTAGVGQPDFYGVVTWSVGGSVLAPRTGGKHKVAPCSPVGSESGRISPTGILTAMTATLTGNTFTNTDPTPTGAGIYLLALDTSPQTATLTNNTFTGWDAAVITDKDAGASLTSTLRRNVFSGNAWGMYDVTNVLQDARENWWGDATGPLDDKTLPGTPNYNNPTGLGNAVSSYIDYSPFYTDAARTTLSVYTLTLLATNGTIEATPTPGPYNFGTLVALVPHPNSSYHFVNWTGDVPSGHETDNPLSITMNANKSVTANFAIDLFTDIGAGLMGVYSSSVAWGDYDNDGDPDILMNGYDGTNHITKVYRNDGSGTFTDQTPLGMVNLSDGSVAWGDYDNDGDLDILLTGGDGISALSKIYRNDGSGQFTDQTSIALTGIVVSSVAWGDYDNDGDLDILLTGSIGSSGISKIYRNNGSNSFEEQTGISLAGVQYSASAWGDYDNDGALDILLTGVADGGGHISKVYRNNGNNSFTEQTSISVPGVAYGSVAWGDYSGDGYLDIVIAGANQPTRVFQNNGDHTFTETASFPMALYSSVAWGDCDNDGDLDILMIGQNIESLVYRNDGGGTFTALSPIAPGVTNSAAAWGDYDNDGDLDILITGRAYAGAPASSRIYRNNTLTANSAPTSPTALSSSVSGTEATLSWGAATDGQTPSNGLTYNLRVGTTPGASNVVGPMANVASGYRRVPKIGPVNLNRSFALKGLTPGQTYYWSVQAVDNALAGGAFATEATFTAPGYTLTVHATNGSVAKTPNLPLYAPGASVSLDATAAAGCHFVNWTGDVPAGHETDNPLSITMNTNKTITANFAVDSETRTITAVGTYTFPTAGISMDFTTLPAGSWTVTISKFPTAPPSPPANVIPYYWEITSTLENHTFSATISIDMTGVPGFNPSQSYLMYYNTTSASWVMVSGTYSAPMFTFTTDHFTPFTFINTPSTPKKLYAGSSAGATDGAVFTPNNTWRDPGAPGGYYRSDDDWSWTGTQVVSVYIVPEVASQFWACDVTLEWSGLNVTYVGVDWGSGSGGHGGMYGIGQQYASNRQATLLGTPATRVRINASRMDNTNFTNVVSGDYIAKVDFRITKPGHTSLSIIGADFRYYVEGSAPSGVYMMPFNAEVKAYLADIATYVATPPTLNLNTGDGKINFGDLTTWSSSYWAGVPGADPLPYRVKNDIGPTEDDYVFANPEVDGRIDFEDLVIFSISYGLSANNQLLKLPAIPQDPVTVSLGRPVVVGNETRIPVMIEGAVVDIRALKIEVTGAFQNFIGAEKGTLLQDYSTPVMVMSKAVGRTAYVDLSIVGLENPGIAAPGEVAVLRFTGTPHIQLMANQARNSANVHLNVLRRRGEGESVPTEYALVQNYPNPFNPTTSIDYVVLAAGRVRLEIYSVLGQRIATVVDQVQEAGFYTAQWNGRDESNNPAASGMYLYKIQAGKFTSVKKMLLLK